MKQNKAQGSLEYLIIIAAVLAIAAIVVLFLTGAFKSAGQNAAGCKQAAARCANDVATTNGQAKCGYCVDSCNVTGVTVVTGSGYDNATAACKAGHPEDIVSNQTA